MEKWTPAVDAFRRNLLQKLTTIPGVEAAASATTIPTGISRAFTFSVLGRPPVPENDRPNAGYTEVTPGYFELFRIPLRSGRFLNERDNASGPPVVVINETLARKTFPNEDPLGKQIRLRFDDFPVEENRARQIVGVVGDVKNLGPSQPTFPEVFVPTRAATTDLARRHRSYSHRPDGDAEVEKRELRSRIASAGCTASKRRRNRSEHPGAQRDEHGATPSRFPSATSAKIATCSLCSPESRCSSP